LIDENDEEFRMKAIDLFKLNFAKPMLLAQREIKKELVKGKFFSYHHLESILKFFVGQSKDFHTFSMNYNYLDPDKIMMDLNDEIE